MANKGNGKSSPRNSKNNSTSSWATVRPNSASSSWATVRPNSRSPASVKSARSLSNGSPASVRSKMSLSNRSGGRLFPGAEELKFLSMLRLSNALPRTPPPRGRKPPLRKSRLGISTSVVRKLFNSSSNNNTPKKSQKRQRSISPARNSGSRPGRRPGKEPKTNFSNNISKRNNSNSN